MEEPADPGRHVLRDRYRAGVRRRGAVDPEGAADDRKPLSGLAPLRWLAEEDLVFEPATETLHRPDCRRLVSPESAQALPAGTVLERVMAPRMCECRPDVTLMLGGARLGAERDAHGR